MAPLDARGVTARADLLRALASVPAEVATAARAASGRPVPDGEWTAGLVVRHLIAVETEVHLARLHDLATQDDPRWGWVEPPPWTGEPALTMDDLLERFADLRAETLATVAALDEAGWARTGTHARLGVFDVEALLRNAVDHDREHLRGLA